MKLILASTSPYRKQQLSKLGIEYICLKPEFDEDTAKTELLENKKSPAEISQILSEQKAKSVSDSFNKDEKFVIISGDQLVEFDSKVLGKPGSIASAAQQLKLMRGKTHRLITSISILDYKGIITHTEIATLKMHDLSDIEIDNYIKKDNPIDCAGSYKIESCGIGLFERIETQDFSAIQGLPMLWLTQKLREYQYELFRSRT